ncbi:MAG: His-Xaa-Ser system protein HxsD [Candidatus Moranbacteria bacterium]|nr:His-Xaa-Ser system protein HxsD [Candidatus Moranbacteria bacterium]
MQNPKSKINIKENQIVFRLNSKNYPLEAILNAAYVFIDRVYVHLDGDPEKEILISLKGKERLDKKQLEALKGEFLNELLNYLLRIEVAKNNQKIREYIVAASLVSSLPSNVIAQSSRSEEETVDWREDPLEIAVPWEEKHAKKAKEKQKKNK